MNKIQRNACGWRYDACRAPAQPVRVSRPSLADMIKARLRWFARYL